MTDFLRWLKKPQTMLANVTLLPDESLTVHAPRLADGRSIAQSGEGRGSPPRRRMRVAVHSVSGKASIVRHWH
jgi:hypothetical protein